MSVATLTIDLHPNRRFVRPAPRGGQHRAATPEPAWRTMLAVLVVVAVGATQELAGWLR